MCLKYQTAIQEYAGVSGVSTKAYLCNSANMKLYNSLAKIAVVKGEAMGRVQTKQPALCTQIQTTIVVQPLFNTALPVACALILGSFQYTNLVVDS